jgi:lipopolysaccharide export system protein LptA
MEKIITIILVLALCGGCVSAKGWSRKDGQPTEVQQLEKDRDECNRGWTVINTAADILLTAGILPTMHYFEAKNCMTMKGYIRLEKLTFPPVTSKSIKGVPPKAASEVEVKPIEEKRISALPSSTTASKEKEEAKKGTPPEDKEAKLVDKSEPIDITSDKVEAYEKENLIIFRGNVVARQKDIVIYADSLEAVTIEEGKGIDRLIDGGNVKIQQGLRVANCQKAIFYNLDQKAVLTGDPKVTEGENIVSGDEIIVDIDKNRLEVKGGPSGRGKATIQPGEMEKVKPGGIEKQK